MTPRPTETTMTPRGSSIISGETILSDDEIRGPRQSSLHSGQSNPQASPSPPKFSGEFEDVGLVEKEYTNARSRSSSRWLVLVLVSWVMFGSYYCYDNPAALNTYLTAKGNGTHGPGLSSTQFNGLYSAYSFPNMVLPFFGGYLVDKLGCRVMVVVFSALLVL